IVRELHPLEVKVLLHFSKEEPISRESLVSKLSYNQGQCNQAFSWLAAKGLLEEKERTATVQFELTELGREYEKNGTPEERILDLIGSQGPLKLPEIAGKLSLENRDVGSAFGNLSKSGILTMDEEKRVCLKELAGEERERAFSRVKSLRDLLALVSEQGVVQEESLDEEKRGLAGSLSKKRGASRGVFRVMEREEITYGFTPTGTKVKKALQSSGISGEEIGSLTPEILQSGEWRKRGFRAYSVKTPPVRVLLGRTNPYVAFLEKLKDKLVSLGFEEFDGPLLETEFWNSDALFMPQFHSARDIHDVFYVKDPTHAKAIRQPYLDNVASTHENGWSTGSRGWGYAFDRDFTRRMILRSQGTVLSAKTLTHAKIPGKYFGVVRCFRPDTVDATHAADFYQTEGIVLGEEVNLKTLLGLLKVFAEEVAGAKEIKYVPGYFPFTEPSVEVHMRHPKIGWIELGGSGIFRPEVTEPLGIKVPVLAWGLGIDRMAMMSMGINDIRDLFTSDLEQVRLRVRR
ncbi:MAG TPA: phenylalanine--tRNA ligase subunit alpha, partial [Spirochaetia bacterium]|nr:phenylalanine--tRNA ligase subunit alpha [Spirochaetia bacterium]